VFVFIFIFYVLPSIYKISFPFKSKSKKKIPAFIILSFLCVLWFITYLAEKDINFDPKGGSLTSMAWAGDHYEVVASHRDVHPDYGTPVIKVTPENIAAFSLRKIEVDDSTIFFSPVDGTPLVYYYVIGSKVDFFNSKGLHPQYGEELLPVTRDFVRSYFLQIETNRKNTEMELIRQRELEEQQRELETQRAELRKH
jgi:hypothetical protein